MDMILELIRQLIQIYSWIIIIYIFSSWLPGARESKLGEILGKISEPYLEPFRRFIPPLGFIDFSPIIAIFVLYLAQMGLISISHWF